MKKTLRSLALVALAAMPVLAGAQLNMKAVWVNAVEGTGENVVSNNIPGLHPKWQNPTSATVVNSNSRFAFGKDGKVYTIDNLQNAIVSWDGATLAKVADLPANAADNFIGTAIAGDDAGNIIVNRCFTNATLSIQKWAVLTNGVLTQVTLSTPLAELGTRGRLDNIGHIVGDVTSEEGGIGYATTQNSGSVIMFHFKGDGSKVTSVTAKAAAEDNATVRGGNGLNTPAPKLATVKDILASATPEKEYYCAGTEYSTGALVDAGANLTGYGNRRYVGVAVFELAGKKYVVRNYTEDVAEKYGVMTFAIYDFETKEIVASWLGSTYYNENGMGTLTAEVVDEHNVNIYTWAVTESNPTPGCFAAMFRVSDEEITDVADGTAANPYEIATVEDLCNAWKKVQANQEGMTYFVQTADIDMAGVKDWHAINGFNGTYTAAINYDGQNHLIKNFSPEVTEADAAAANYYAGSIFGVLTGTVKNLGVVDADIVNTIGQGGGFLGAYAGQSKAAGLAKETTIENVFVTGTYNAKGNGNYFGGIAGTTGTDVVIKSCFVNANIIAEKNTAGLVGRLRNGLTVSETYVAGTITCPGTAALLISSDQTPAVKAEGLTAFNTGVAAAVVGAVVEGDVNVADADNKEDLVSEVVDFWENYTDEYLVYGLPGLAGFNYTAEGDGPTSGIVDAAVVDADAPAVYYNLQGVQVANPENGLYIVRRGNKVTKELLSK